MLLVVQYQCRRRCQPAQAGPPLLLINAQSLQLLHIIALILDAAETAPVFMFVHRPVVSVPAHSWVLASLPEPPYLHHGAACLHHAYVMLPRRRVNLCKRLEWH